MDDPVTELDERFSDPGAIPTPWSTTQAVLAGAELFWLTTVRADGRPHVTPLVGVWLDGALYFCTGPGEQKTLNLERHPLVALTTGCAEWRHGVDVVVEGRATPVRDTSLLTRLADAWSTKWDGRWIFRTGEGGFVHDASGPALVFEVMPVKVLSFAKGEFAHTRHRPPR